MSEVVKSGCMPVHCVKSKHKITTHSFGDGWYFFCVIIIVYGVDIMSIKYGCMPDRCVKSNI